MCIGWFHEQAMDYRAGSGENALRFVDMAIGELRSMDEGLDNGAGRARDGGRARPPLADAQRGHIARLWSGGASPADWIAVTSGVRGRVAS